MQSRRRTTFVIVFVAVFGALQALWVAAEGSATQRWILATTVEAAALALNAIRPDDAVHAAEHRLVSPRLQLNVLRGCDGVEAFFLLIAAVWGFPATMRARASALILGGALVFIGNALRIAALYMTAREGPALFELVHGYIAPTIMVVALALFFLSWIIWLERLSTRRPAG